MVAGISDTQEGNQNLIDKYQDRHLRDRAFELSLSHSQVVLRQIGATEADIQLYGKLASSILYLNPGLRAPASILTRNQRGQSALWSYSISGDLPIVLLNISDTENIDIVKQLIKAQAYWHSKGLATDLVILNEDPSGYRQVLQEQIQSLIASTGVSTSEKTRKNSSATCGSGSCRRSHLASNRSAHHYFRHQRNTCRSGKQTNKRKGSGF